MYAVWRRDVYDASFGLSFLYLSGIKKEWIVYLCPFSVQARSHIIFYYYTVESIVNRVT